MSISAGKAWLIAQFQAARLHNVLPGEGEQLARERGGAKGGTGDVLTGILTGLLAQSYSATEAAILGVYLHGMAGDIVAQDRGERGLTASDLADYLPLAYKKLKTR